MRYDRFPYLLERWVGLLAGWWADSILRITPNLQNQNWTNTDRNFETSGRLPSVAQCDSFCFPRPRMCMCGHARGRALWKCSRLTRLLPLPCVTAQFLDLQSRYRYALFVALLELFSENLWRLTFRRDTVHPTEQQQLLVSRLSAHRRR
jgi:hypothetical protein